jgi:alcohol dehydrogenase class IV
VTSATRFVEEIVSLLQKLDVPSTAAEARSGAATSTSVQRDLLMHIMEDPCIATNPRTVTASGELVDLVAGVAG